MFVKNADHVHVSDIRVTTSAATVEPLSGVYAEPPPDTQTSACQPLVEGAKVLK